MEELFSNKVYVKSGLIKVRQFILNIDRLMEWNPAIINLDRLSENTLIVYRANDALNTREVILIKNNNKRITFESTGGKLEYVLEFELVEQKESTLIVEKFYAISGLSVSKVLLAPIAKNAFNRNLNILKQMIEFKVTKM